MNAELNLPYVTDNNHVGNSGMSREVPTPKWHRSRGHSSSKGPQRTSRPSLLYRQRNRSSGRLNHAFKVTQGAGDEGCVQTEPQTPESWHLCYIPLTCLPCAEKEPRRENVIRLCSVDLGLVHRYFSYKVPKVVWGYKHLHLQIRLGKALGVGLCAKRITGEESYTSNKGALWSDSYWRVCKARGKLLSQDST